MLAPEAALDLLVRAAEVSGDIALKHWKKDPKTWDKGDGAGPVTEADLEVDEYLKGALHGAHPDYGWLSEETEDSDARLARSRVFVVDPIDGTRSFASGSNTWAHSLALVEDGRPIAGVVYLPVREKMYTGVAGDARLNGTRIEAAQRPGLAGAEVLAPKITFEPENWAGDPPNVTRHFRPSLAYRLALVGEGRFDAMVTLRPAWEWDIAAGALIAAAAGAQVSDQRGEALMFNSPNAQTQGALVAGQRVHADLMAGLVPQG